MRVTAIEGLGQIAKEIRPIRGYHIKETTFEEPIVVSSSEHCVETQIKICPVKKTSDKPLHCKSLGSASTTGLFTNELTLLGTFFFSIQHTGHAARPLNNQ